MDPKVFYTRIVDPTMQWLAATPGIGASDTPEARVMVMSIAGQEGRWKYRKQLGNGPARGFWQFENGPVSGTQEVLRSVPGASRTLCEALDVPYDRDTIFEALTWNDTLACGMARLLLWGDPQALPRIGDVEGAWQQYIRRWHPGMPHRETWDGFYAQSRALVGV